MLLSTSQEDVILIVVVAGPCCCSLCVSWLFFHALDGVSVFTDGIISGTTTVLALAAADQTGDRLRQATK